MMAGTGVSVAGAAMLRTRRRDVSIKPNRRLDRKSSRGMIYENEELRLRTININAEVEQGQNDIKKLRRENEQLRKEIWSLRDEYDKLEELLKTQKSNENSDEFEDRSGEDDDAYSDYSIEEEEEEEEVDQDQEERLENAENQKISSEKMSSSVHRLHVDFDDLSVVDEEEELKKDKDRKDGSCSEDNQTQREAGIVAADQRIKAANTHVQDGFYHCSPAYDVPAESLSSSSYGYFSECPFVFPNPTDPNYPKMLPMENPNLLMSPCSRMYGGPLTPLPSLETPPMGRVSPIFGIDDHTLAHNNRNEANAQIPVHAAQIGWRNDVIATPGIAEQSAVQKSQLTSPNLQITGPNSPGVQGARPAGQVTFCDGINRLNANVTMSPKQRILARQGAVAEVQNGNDYHNIGMELNVPNLPQRRNVLFKQPTGYFNDTLFKDPRVEAPNSAEGLTQNGWDFSRGVKRGPEEDACGREREGVKENRSDSPMPRDQEGIDRAVSEASTLPMPDKPKHFFAPLPSKLKFQRDLDEKLIQDSPTTPTTPSIYGTTNSSSSGKTSSTVVSRNNLLMKKGSVDLYVKGGFPAGGSPGAITNGAQNAEQKTFLSTENLLIDDVRNSSKHSSSNTLTKSLSCQDLSLDPQYLPFSEKLRIFNAENKAQKLTKSDNTLDNLSNSSKPYKSQLNVTLRLPKFNLPSSPDTPEIPKLPEINYKLFNNPFLRNFDQGCSNYANLNIQCPITRPLSIQVSESVSNPSVNNNLNYSSPMLLQPSGQMPTIDGDYYKLRGPNRMEDSQRLLMATNQNRGFEGDNANRIIPLVKKPPEFQATSFEGPNPHTLLQFEPEGLHKLPPSCSMMQSSQRLYQNMPILPEAPVIFSPNGQPFMPRTLYDNIMAKVPAQTQTSIDGDSHREDKTKKGSESLDAENPSAPSSPMTMRRKRTLRKERSASTKDKRPLSPAAQRRRERMRKQSSVTSSELPDSLIKTPQKARKFSITTTTSEVQEKNESRSSSSGLDSPRKEQRRRISLYFNAKKRPSLASVKMGRSLSMDNAKDRYLLGGDNQEGTTTNSERERTNSVSSRETIAKGRKMSTSSGNVPWCACWGNGCI